MAQPSKEYTRKPESTLIRERYERIKLAYQLKLKNNSFTPGEQNQMQADMQALADQYKAAYQAESHQSHEHRLDIHTAESILGSDFLGPDAIKQTFGFEVHDIPPIPFSQSELEQAKELGQQLVLYVDQTPDGKPLSIMGIHNLLNNTTSDGNKLLFNTVIYKDQTFANEPPQLGWKLTNKEILPYSTNKNYLQQTEILIDYLTTQVFKKTMPLEYQDAITEFNDKRTMIEGLISSNLKKAAKELANLKITRLTRETPAEVMYRLALTEKTTKARLLKSTYTWTSLRGSDGGFVGLGDFGFNKCVHVGGGRPDDISSFAGVCFSRR